LIQNAWDGPERLRSPYPISALYI